MSSIWNIEGARRERKSALLKYALEIKNLWGKLEPEWNARDEEYTQGKSKVLHYTALHTQPWHPFPHEFVYQESPVGNVWTELEHRANSAGFQMFGRTQPSSQFAQLVQMVSGKKVTLDSPSGLGQVEPDTLDSHQFISSMDNPSLLQYQIEPSQDLSPETNTLFSTMPSLKITPFNWCTLDSSRPNKPCDIVYASDGLTLIPDEDVPWLLEEIFSLASQLVYVTIHDEKLLPEIPSYLESHTRDFQWWANQFQAISTRYPTIHWTLVFHTTNRQSKPSTIVRHGGRWLTSPPRIWILSDGKMGHSTQSEGLAKALGWPYEIKQLHFHTWNNTQKLLWSLLPPHILGLKKAQSSSLEPPWPDVVISTGWRPAPIARWIREQNGGKTRIIQLGRKGGGSADLFDVVVTPAYYGFPPHPHRIETLAPLNEVAQENLDEVSRRWPNLFKNTPHPRILLVVGGSTAQIHLHFRVGQRHREPIKRLSQFLWGKNLCRDLSKNRQRGESGLEVCIRARTPFSSMATSPI